MPRMPGFLQSRSKKEQAEWDLVQTRTAARLAAMFREETGQEPAPDEDAASAESFDGGDLAVEAPMLERAPRERRSGGRRPKIIVVGDTQTAAAKPARPRARRVVQRGAGPNGWTVVDPSVRDDPGEPVPVMAMPADGPAGEDIWRLPSEPAPDLLMATEAPVEVAETVEVTEAIARPSEDVAPRAEVVTSAEAVSGLEDPSVGSVPAPIPAAARPKVARTPARRKSRARSRAVVPPPPPPAPVIIAHCPYCALVLDPAPTVSRRCDRCLQRIIVKRVDGQAVYLTEAAVQVFDSERRRIANSARLTRERERWLALAATAGAPAGRRTQLAAARLTDEVVVAARSLYLTTVERAFRNAKHDRDWDGASRLRRDQAMALNRIAGSPASPPADIVTIYQEGVAAELRGVAEISRDAELVSARCCEACRADDGRIFRITSELRTPRLPHVDCPKGLCRCHWDLAARDRRTIRRYLQRRPGTASRAAAAAEAPVAPTEAAPTA
jgi:hypothetical protein